MYCLAFMLSTALMITSFDVQNLSSKNSSVSGQTLSFCDWKLHSGLIFLQIEQATSLLFFPMCYFLNKNCLFKLLISMLSSSVQVTIEFSLLLQPIKLNIFKNSQPRAPAPTKNMFDFSTFFINSSPKIVW